MTIETFFFNKIYIYINLVQYLLFGFYLINRSGVRLLKLAPYLFIWIISYIASNVVILFQSDLFIIKVFASLILASMFTLVAYLIDILFDGSLEVKKRLNRILYKFPILGLLLGFTIINLGGNLLYILFIYTLSLLSIFFISKKMRIQQKANRAFKLYVLSIIFYLLSLLTRNFFDINFLVHLGGIFFIFSNFFLLVSMSELFSRKTLNS